MSQSEARRPSVRSRARLTPAVLICNRVHAYERACERFCLSAFLQVSGVSPAGLSDSSRMFLPLYLTTGVARIRAKRQDARYLRRNTGTAFGHCPPFSAHIRLHRAVSGPISSGGANRFPRDVRRRRAGNGDFAPPGSSRFTRERSQVRNPPRPLTKPPHVGGFCSWSRVSQDALGSDSPGPVPISAR